MKRYVLFGTPIHTAYASLRQRNNADVLMWKRTESPSAPRTLTKVNVSSCSGSCLRGTSCDGRLLFSCCCVAISIRGIRWCALPANAHYFRAVLETRCGMRDVGGARLSQIIQCMGQDKNCFRLLRFGKTVKCGSLFSSLMCATSGSGSTIVFNSLVNFAIHCHNFPERNINSGRMRHCSDEPDNRESS